MLNCPGLIHDFEALNAANSHWFSSMEPTEAASSGHTAMQWPHPRELSPVIRAFPSMISMVSDGHTRTQEAHPMHFDGSIVVVTGLFNFNPCAQFALL
jgi:hypothetical protein